MATCPRCRSSFSEVPLNGRCPSCDKDMWQTSRPDSSFSSLEVYGPMAVLAIAFIIGLFFGGSIVAGLLFPSILLYLWSLIWAYGDGERKGKPGIAVALFVALAVWPIGFLAWVIFS